VAGSGTEAFITHVLDVLSSLSAGEASTSSGANASDQEENEFSMAPLFFSALIRFALLVDQSTKVEVASFSSKTAVSAAWLLSCVALIEEIDAAVATSAGPSMFNSMAALLSCVEWGAGLE
jgi:hypothetical protein